MKKFIEQKKNLLIFATMLLFATVFLSSTKAHAAFFTPVYQVLMPQGGSFSGVGKVVANIWGIFMGSVNTLVLAVLIYVAFMNILRVQMDSYAIKKFLPTFIMAVILANFSFLICRVVIDLGNIAMSIFLVGAQPGTSVNPGGNTSAAVNGVSNAFDGLLKVSPCGPGVACANVDTANYWGYIFFYIIQQAIIAVGAVFVFILGFLFIVRNYYIYFLVAVSPIYFLSMALPMTKKYFSQWMGQFSKWVFMPIISVFWIWLAGQFVAQIPDTGGGILIAFFAILCFYMAFTAPFKVDKTIGTWGGLGKKAWGKTGGAAWNATGGAGINAAKGWVNDKYSNVKRSTVNWSKDNLPVVKQWSRTAARGRLRQAVVNSAFEDKDKKREQQALVDFMNTREFKKRNGFEDPTFKKLKGQVKKLLTDDERDAETYKQHSTSFLVGNVALNKGEARKKDGSIDADSTIEINGEKFHHASVEYMAQNNGKKDVEFYDGYGKKMKKKDTRTLIAESTAAATQIKLNANNSAANSRSAETDYVGPEHPVAEPMDKHRNRLKLGPVDPRTMSSTGVPDEQAGMSDEPVAEEAAAEAVPVNPMLADAARRRARNGYRGTTPAEQRAGASATAAARMAAARRGEGVPLADATPEEIAAQNAAVAESARNSGESAAAGQNGQGGPAAPGGGGQQQADFSRMEELLERISGQLEDGASSDQKAAELTREVQKMGPNGGAGGVQDVRIAGTTQQGKADALIVANIANKRAQTVEQKARSKDNERVLQALHNIADHGTGEEVGELSEQGDKEVDNGE